MEVEELSRHKMLVMFRHSKKHSGKNLKSTYFKKQLMLTLKTMKIYCSQKMMWRNYHLFTELKRIINCSIKFSTGEYLEDITYKLIKMISRENKNKPSHIY